MYKYFRVSQMIQNTTNERFPIRTVSELTGVNSVTLRAWERRYGLIQPVRKESGHRLYTRQHIDHQPQVDTFAIAQVFACINCRFECTDTVIAFRVKKYGCVNVPV